MGKQITVPTAPVPLPVATVPVPTATTPRDDVLNDGQRARAEALRIAREVLVNRGLGSSGHASPAELITIARYIETGAWVGGAS